MSDKTVPFVYYVMTPMTDDIKNNARIPLDSTVKQKLEAIANDTTRDDNDQLKKMAQELTTTGSVSIKNELMKLRKPSTSSADGDNAVRKSQPRYNTGKTNSNAADKIRANSR